jgi:hypothetical protein
MFYGCRKPVWKPNYGTLEDLEYELYKLYTHRVCTLREISGINDGIIRWMMDLIFLVISECGTGDAEFLKYRKKKLIHGPGHPHYWRSVDRRDTDLPGRLNYWEDLALFLAR